MEHSSSSPKREGLVIREASEADIPAMVEVVNAAFEVEAFFVNCPRTHPEQLREHLRTGRFLLGFIEDELIASVYCEVRGERGYIGMLSVKPGYQRGGIGRVMMNAAEDALRALGCSLAEISVVSIRTGLLPIYRKLGYEEAGVHEPHEDLRRKLTVPVQLISMEKRL